MSELIGSPAGAPGCEVVIENRTSFDVTYSVVEDLEAPPGTRLIVIIRAIKPIGMATEGVAAGSESSPT